MARGTGKGAAGAVRLSRSVELCDKAARFGGMPSTDAAAGDDPDAAVEGR
jgi:hypothetical protein